MKYITEEKTQRGKYAFLLVVNKQIKGTLFANWWQSANEVITGKCYAACTAHCFYATAGVLVYRAALDDDGREVWELWDEFDAYAPDFAGQAILTQLPPNVRPR